MRDRARGQANLNGLARFVCYHDPDGTILELIELEAAQPPLVALGKRGVTTMYAPARSEGGRDAAGRVEIDAQGSGGNSSTNILDDGAYVSAASEVVR